MRPVAPKIDCTPQSRDGREYLPGRTVVRSPQRPAKLEGGPSARAVPARACHPRWDGLGAGDMGVPEPPAWRVDVAHMPEPPSRRVDFPHVPEPPAWRVDFSHSALRPSGTQASGTRALGHSGLGHCVPRGLPALGSARSGVCPLWGLPALGSDFETSRDRQRVDSHKLAQPKITPPFLGRWWP